MAGKIFINYRRDDSIGMAGRLHDRLAQTFGRDKLFMDVDHIPAGTDFVAHLNSQVAGCDVVLVVIGPIWLVAKDESGGRRLDNPDDFVAIEIAAALARDIRVIPVLVDGARMPKASDLPDSLKPLARRQAVDVRHSHFGHDAEALVKRMREALGDKPAGPRRWRMRAAIGAAAVAVLLLIGWGGYAFIQHMLTTVEQAAQQREAEFKAELERQARAVTEAEAEAERQRLAAVKAEQERQARAAAELEAKKATEAEQRQPAVVNPEVARRGAWFGVKIQQVTDEIAKSLNITPARGALVVGVVEEGPAKAGGIVVGDVIVKFDGKDIKEVGDIPRIVADTPVGKEVQVTIIRNGAEYTRTVKIGVLTAELEEKRKADEEARARYSAGKTEANAGDYDRAIAYYSEAIRLDPKNAIVFASRGFAYQKKGDYDRAITDYSEAIQLNPTYALVFNNRGNAYQNKGDYDRAIADYSEAIRLDPKNAIAFNNRGNAYGKKGWTTGDYDRAVADYSEAIRLDPQYASAFCNRGRTKLSIKDSGGDEDVAKARQLDASVCR